MRRGVGEVNGLVGLRMKAGDFGRETAKRGCYSVEFNLLDRPSHRGIVRVFVDHVV